MLFILFFGHCVGCPSVVVVCHVVYFVFGRFVGCPSVFGVFLVVLQHDKQRPQKDSLHNDQKTK
jgi:hypothetical protein